MSLVTSLRHFFIPHQTNNHRAKALHVDMLLVYVLLFALFNLGIRAAHKVAPGVLGYATDINAQQLLADTNDKRAEAGLAPLTLSSTLSVAAANKAADMFAKNYWAHNSPTGATPWILSLGQVTSIRLPGKIWPKTSLPVAVWWTRGWHRPLTVRTY